MPDTPPNTGTTHPPADVPDAAQAAAKPEDDTPTRYTSRYTGVEPGDGGAICILDRGVLAMRVYGGFNVRKILDKLNAPTAGSPAPADDDPTIEDTMRRALAAFGWTCGPDFWQRYYSDPWVFNLANAVERLSRQAMPARPSGLCPVCGQWPHNCDPQVDHTGDDDE